jgi:hypothetical protein
MSLLGILIALTITLTCGVFLYAMMRVGASADEADDGFAERIVAGDMPHLPRQLRKSSSHSTPIAQQGK